jgi:acyl transferase domain-containing protein/surfactin synthase thioesterase subunit/acyl carrier protein
VTDGVPPTGIAIIGIACRLPGARTAAEFWDNLCAGTESIRFFTDQELLDAGVPAEALRRPDYVRAAPVLDDFDTFDAAFFGYSPREATMIEPQQRLFLETAWQTFEDAGYDPGGDDHVVGVFAGSGGFVTSYMMAHCTDPAFPGQTGGLEHISNDKDFLSTRVSYKLDLTGPSITVQTACSTSLVALHLACRSIESGECDMALAGAATVRVPHATGYVAPKGSIYSSDGRCRAFDADGTGTIFGSGVAAVLLKDAAEAIEDGDHIYGIIRSTAVNNDGGRKVSYTAPSVLGEARAMAEALALAEVPAESIGFVECHATGTALGDPLEIQALTRAFRTQTAEAGFCAVGSAKRNIGHAEQAAGLAGLIKATLAIKHGVIPPTRVETPNPSIPFEGSPFYLARELTAWPDTDEHPRRAGVNSLGIGGTNAFAVIEQAPDSVPSGAPPPDVQLLCLSARSETALRARAAQFADVLEQAAPEDVGRICHTARISRSGFEHRLAVSGHVESMRRQLAAYADGGDGRGMVSHRAQPGTVAFLFSGQGFQYPGMARTLFRTQPVFRRELMRCAGLAKPHLDRPLLNVIFGEDDHGDALRETAYTQPALFAVEYALARMWSSWGVTPDAVMGHSIGEFTACCVAGVFDLQPALELVVRRGSLMQSLSDRGGMLAIMAPRDAVLEAVGDIDGLAIAASNGPVNTVVSGSDAAISEAEGRLTETSVAHKRLEVSHGFHSGIVDSILQDLEAAAGSVDSRAPDIPLVANRTGEVFDAAPTAAYWRDHARGMVRFDDGMRTLAALGHTTFLEVGPGPGLLSLGRTCVDSDAEFLASLDPRREDWAVLFDSLRRLYLAGHAIQWDEVNAGFDNRRIPLPGYPFERRRYWLSDGPAAQRIAGVSPAPGDSVPSGAPASFRDHLYRLEWRPAPSPAPPAPSAEGAWLVLADEGGIGESVAQALEGRGQRCPLLFHSEASPRGKAGVVETTELSDQLRAVMDTEGAPLRGVINAWALDASGIEGVDSAHLDRSVDLALGSTLRLLQTLTGDETFSGIRQWTLTRGGARPGPAKGTDPISGALLGMGRTLALEHPTVWGGVVDLPVDGIDPERIADELLRKGADPEVALRPGARLVPRLAPWTPEPDADRRAPRTDGSYLVTGGLGAIGRRIARWLVEDHGVRHLVLVGRSAPSPEVEGFLTELRRSCESVEVLQADVSDEADVQAVFDAIDAADRPLRGIVHCAGVLADAIASRMEWDEFTRGLAPKVRGAWLLHRHTADRDLDVFQLHSSFLSWTGSAGQANYTAGNAFLDALVDHRRARGLPASALNWGPWADAGMSTHAGEKTAGMWRRLGISTIPPDTAMEALSFLHRSGARSGGLTVTDWGRYAEAQPQLTPFLEEILQESGPDSDGPGRSDRWRARLGAAEARDLPTLLVEAICEVAADELGFEAPLDPHRPLAELGLDSLLSVTLANRIETSLGVTVPLVRLVSGPSIADLVRTIADSDSGETSAVGPAESGADHAARPPDVTHRPVASTNGAGPKGAGPNGSHRSPGRWLVFPSPRPDARMRMFCFPYAGAGAPVFQPWGNLVDPSIELVAVEAPGRAGRIDEQPIDRLSCYIEALMEDLEGYLDKPFALYGHCQGAITLHEVARRLVPDDRADLLHLFVSGARAPHHVFDIGPFEESLTERLLLEPSYNPALPISHQSEAVLREVLLHFDIGDTERFLVNDELSALILPAVRADFATLSDYAPERDGPWDLPVTCLVGLDDTYVTRRSALAWSDYTQARFSIHYLPSTHYMVVEDRESLISVVNREVRQTFEEHRRRETETPAPTRHPELV